MFRFYNKISVICFVLSVGIFIVLKMWVVFKTSLFFKLSYLLLDTVNTNLVKFRCGNPRYSRWNKIQSRTKINKTLCKFKIVMKIQSTIGHNKFCVQTRVPIVYKTSCDIYSGDCKLANKAQLVKCSSSIRIPPWLCKLLSVTKLGELSPQRQLTGRIYLLCNGLQTVCSLLFYVNLIYYERNVVRNLIFQIIEVSVDNHINKHLAKALRNSLICLFQSFLICIFCHCLYKEIHIALISPRYYTLIFYVRSEFLTKIICSSLWGNSNKLLFTYIDFSVEMVAEDKSRFISLIPVASLFPSKIRGRLLSVFLLSLQNKWF